MTPRATALRIESDAALPAGSGDRFAGYAVIGQPFASGHVLAFRRFVASSLGPAYTSVWHRSPSRRWTFFSTIAPELSCARYFGGEVERNVVSRIDLTWPTPWEVHVAVGDTLRWSVTLTATASTRIFDIVAAALPEAAWQSPVLLRAFALGARALFGVGRMNLTGCVPNGQSFVARPRSAWPVGSSRAVVDGVDVGMPGPLAKQAALRDLWIPQRGLFVAASVAFQAREGARRTRSALAPRTDWGSCGPGSIAPPASTPQSWSRSGDRVNPATSTLDLSRPRATL